MAIGEHGLKREQANHVPLTPVSFLVRAASVFGGRTAVIHGERRFRAARVTPPTGTHFA